MTKKYKMLPNDYDYFLYLKKRSFEKYCVAVIITNQIKFSDRSLVINGNIVYDE